MENKELNILMEEMKIKVKGADEPDNYFLLFAYEMGLMPLSKKLAVPILPEDIHRAFAYYLKKKGVRTDYTTHLLFMVIRSHCPSKPIRIKKCKSKGRAMTPIKLVNPCSAIFALLKEIDSVVE